jgi:hypothetical protein
MTNRTRRKIDATLKAKIALEHLRLGFEELVIISLRHDQCRFIRLLNDPDTVIRRKGSDKLDRLTTCEASLPREL